MASSSTPSLSDRMAMANAKAREARLASESKRTFGEKQEAAVTSFASPLIAAEEEPSKRLRSESSPADDPSPTVASGSGLVPVLATSEPSSSSSEDGFIFKPTDDLIDKMLDGRNLQGRYTTVLALVELLGAADYPPQDPPSKIVCILFFMQLRGVGTVGWSATDKKFFVDGYTPSKLNPATPWAATLVPGDPPPESGSDKPVDAVPGKASSDDLNVSGGASSSAPALS